jgi:hypothetical protein
MRVLVAEDDEDLAGQMLWITQIMAKMRISWVIPNLMMR